MRLRARPAPAFPDRINGYLAAALPVTMRPLHLARVASPRDLIHPGTDLTKLRRPERTTPLKKLLAGCLILFVIVIIALIVGFFALPKNYHVMRTVTIQGSPADIYAHVGHLDRWPEWTAWNTTKYPTLAYEPFQQTEGPGARMIWTMDKSRGELTLTQASPDTGIGYDLVFDEAYRSKGEITFEPSGSTTTVTWKNHGDLEGIMVLFGPFLDSMMGPDFQLGLEQLKQKVEQQR